MRRCRSLLATTKAAISRPLLPAAPGEQPLALVKPSCAEVLASPCWRSRVRLEDGRTRPLEPRPQRSPAGDVVGEEAPGPPRTRPHTHHVAGATVPAPLARCEVAEAATPAPWWPRPLRHALAPGCTHVCQGTGTMASSGQRLLAVTVDGTERDDGGSIGLASRWSKTATKPI